MADLRALIERLTAGESLTVEEYTSLIQERTPDIAARLAAAATDKRQAIYGNTVYIRGLIDATHVALHTHNRYETGNVHHIRHEPAFRHNNFPQLPCL